jgi:putative aminopeptidase FrvX
MEASLTHRLAVLREITSIPTAPTHEARVGRYVVAFLRRLGLAPARDEFGNLIVRYRRGETAGQPPIAFVAHMDHPALEVATVAGDRVTATLLGGVASACFDRPCAVRVYPNGDESGVSGTVVGYVDRGNRDVTLELAMNGPVAPGDFGVFDFPAYREDGDRVYLRTADDLGGCAAILLAIEAIVESEAPADVFGVFTRAEEIGLCGAILLAEAGTLPPGTVVVSLETSKELPGAVMGEGPVIRVGDKSSAFDRKAEAVLLAARARLEKADPTAKVQRRLMDGGTCEATAFCERDYPATGVALPLGNYHNVGADESGRPLLSPE